MYYEVLISSHRYHADKPLTYAYETELPRGSIVIVPLQKQLVPAVILDKVPRPAFTARSVERLVTLNGLRDPLLKLAQWLPSYYPAPFGQIMSLFLPSSLTKIPRPNKEKEIRHSTKPIPLPPLTNEQQQTLKLIGKSDASSILLHGDTGTGKTRIYLELIKNTLAASRSCIVLTPEIGLTPQLEAVIREHFPDKLVVMHSELSETQRRTRWLDILRTDEPLIVLGPRSALFAPLKNVGLIVIDECHDSAYKQEQAPHYVTSRVAAKLAQLYGAQLIMASATPLIADYYAFLQKKLPIIRMKEQAIQHDHGSANIVVVDRKEKSEFSRSPWISNVLLSAMGEALDKQQQSLVFLNRRGTARLVICQQCGWQELCPKCDLPLTYHGDNHILLCHTCGYSKPPVLVCPMCHSEDILFKSLGTKAIVEEIQRLFPHAKIGRFDSDNAKADRLEHQYDKIREGSIDVLVGTQMLGKGLDLPKLAVVGIVTAETSLSFPDYSAEERTYQLINQAIGRVHRGHLPGTAIIQTFQADNPLIHAAAHNDYSSFYNTQITERKQFLFPPFCYTLKITCSRKTSKSAQQVLEKITRTIAMTHSKIEVSQPMPAFISKSRNLYRWQIIVKAMNRSKLIAITQQLPATCNYDIDPVNLL